MELNIKFPVLFKNKDVQFLKDAQAIIGVAVNNMGADSQGAHDVLLKTVMEILERMGNKDDTKLNALSHEVRTLSESLEIAANSLKSPEIDGIGRKIDNLSLKIEQLAVAVHDYAKIEAEKAKENEDETVLRLGALE